MAQSAEQVKRYHVSKAFRGLNTKANRTAIDDSEFSWIENAQPVGAGNVKIVAAPSRVTNNASANVAWGNAIVDLRTGFIGSNNLIFGFQSNGAAQTFNVSSNIVSNIAASATFSGAGNRMAQWKNERVVISDPTYGLFTYDGNVTVKLGAVGVIALSNAGAGYTTAPGITISAPNQAGGVQAVAEAFVSGNIITAITLTEPGTGYTASPTVTITGGGGANGQAVASFVTFATGTVFTVIESGGTGYTNVGNISVGFSGGGGSNAAATAIASNGVITQIVMTNPGAGYTTNPTVTITGGNGSNAIVKGYAETNAVTDIVSFSGRMWVSQGRTVTYSAAGSYNDFVSVSAGSVFIADGTLHGSINSMLAANNFLYLFGDDSINVFSDVRVTSSGTTLFTNTNLSASVGTDNKNAVFPFFRYVMMLNDYGVYGLIGSTTSKISDALDGIFPLIDFAQPVSGGQVLLNNILCAAFSFTATVAIGGTRVLQAVFFDKKWFLTSQGALTRVTSVPVGSLIRLYGTTGTDLWQLYANSSGAVSSTVQTALWSLSDPIRDKQALKFGVEATLTQGGTLNLTVDSESNSSPSYTLTNTVITWVNNSSQTIPWVNSSNVTISWVTGAVGYFLYKSDAQQWGKYLGFTVTSNSPGFVYNTFELEHELRARF